MIAAEKPVPSRSGSCSTTGLIDFNGNLLCPPGTGFYPPVCSPILLLLSPERPIATEPHAKDTILFAPVHGDRTAGRLCGRAPDWDRGSGFRTVLQFRWSAPATTPTGAAARTRRLVRWRPVRSLPAAGAPRDRELFQGAAAAKTRHRPRAQCAGARRCHGRLARLRPRGCLHRATGHGRDPPAQDRLRPDPLSAQGRSGRLGGCGKNHPSRREARRDRRHARPERSHFAARAGKIRRQDRRQDF